VKPRVGAGRGARRSEAAHNQVGDAARAGAACPPPAVERGGCGGGEAREKERLEAAACCRAERVSFVFEEAGL